jgi:hypothetical protein
MRLPQCLEAVPAGSERVWVWFFVIELIEKRCLPWVSPAAIF